MAKSSISTSTKGGERSVGCWLCKFVHTCSLQRMVITEIERFCFWPDNMDAHQRRSRRGSWWMLILAWMSLDVDVYRLHGEPQLRHHKHSPLPSLSLPPLNLIRTNIFLIGGSSIRVRLVGMLAVDDPPEACLSPRKRPWTRLVVTHTPCTSVTLFWSSAREVRTSGCNDGVAWYLWL